MVVQAAMRRVRKVVRAAMRRARKVVQAVTRRVRMVVQAEPVRVQIPRVRAAHITAVPITAGRVPVVHVPVALQDHKIASKAATVSKAAIAVAHVRRTNKAMDNARPNRKTASKVEIVRVAPNILDPRRVNARQCKNRPRR